MKIATCQLPFVHRDMDRAISLVQSCCVEAQQQDAKLVCFPECFVQGYEVSKEHVRCTAIDLESSEFSGILEKVEHLEPVLVVGLIEKEAGRFFNSAVAIRKGTVIARYRKCHLVGNERAVFEAGKEFSVFDVCGTKVGINICYDLQFAESANMAVHAGAELLACPCNNMMRPATAEHWKHRHTVMRSERARDAKLWIATSDVTGEHNGRISYGPTEVMNADGMVLAQVPLMTTGMAFAEFDDASQSLSDSSGSEFQVC